MKLSEILSNAGMSVLIYAESGMGKTHFCGTLPGKTLYYAVTPNEVMTLKRSPNIDNIELVSTPTLDNHKKSVEVMDTFFHEICQRAVDEHYDNIVVDNLTELGSIMLIELAKAANNNGVPSQKNYNEAQWCIRRYVRLLVNAAICHGKRVVVNAHEMELVLGQEGDTVTLSKVHPMVCGKKLAPEVEGLFDVVAHLETKFDKEQKPRRFFRLMGNEHYMAKDRVCGRVGCWATPDDLFHLNNQEA